MRFDEIGECAEGIELEDGMINEKNEVRNIEDC